MYELEDTIIAVSSPTSENKVIVRLTGPDTIPALSQTFTPLIKNNKPTVTSGTVTVDTELKLDANLYLFGAPNSYTGQDVAELVRLGAEAVGSTSGVIKADDPVARLDEMIKALRQTWDEVNA